MERVAALPVARLAPTLAIGPAPDPRAPDAEPPWRVRLDPPGQTLDARLRRAPLPDDEVIALGGELADAVQSLHAAGAVLRDLDPRAIVLGDDGRAWFTDIGHARLAILSSRTASSLLLESSPYVAPEALLGTVVDARADVYSLGVVLWRALTGDVPFQASLIASRVPRSPTSPRCARSAPQAAGRPGHPLPRPRPRAPPADRARRRRRPARQGRRHRDRDPAHHLPGVRRGDERRPAAVPALRQAGRAVPSHRAGRPRRRRARARQGERGRRVRSTGSRRSTARSRPPSRGSTSSSAIAGCTARPSSPSATPCPPS